MTKKRKKQNKAVVNSKNLLSPKKPDKNNISDLYDSAFNRANYLLKAVIYIIVPLAFIGIFLYIKSQRNISQIVELKKNFQVITISLLMLSIFALFSSLSANIAGKFLGLKLTDQQKQSGLLLGLRAITTIFSIVLYLNFLNAGYSDKLIKYISTNLFPKISDGFTYLISHVLEWITSGIIGGVAYDLLKRSIVKTSKKEQQLKNRKTNR